MMEATAPDAIGDASSTVPTAGAIPAGTQYYGDAVR